MIVFVTDLLCNVHASHVNMITVWADNADYISLQYAGTGALKTDFTRYDYFKLYGCLYVS